jgi:hypothetical protein
MQDELPERARQQLPLERVLELGLEPERQQQPARHVAACSR